MMDAELMALLESDPETGMTTLIEKCSGLLWKVASSQLNNEEDIRDCVSETFSEFYLHHENYDPEKGTLSSYLAAIARRRALHRKENNLRQDSLYIEPPEEDPYQQLEQRSELDDALSQLSAEDERILRMKYYQGLSVQEIAATLNLPYETVKKRHQRSLKKLHKWLTTGLVLALIVLLAACVYVVLQYFGIIPGYGAVNEPGASAYILTEPAEAEFDLGTAIVKDAILIDGFLSLSIEIDFADTAAEQLFFEWQKYEDINVPSTMPYAIINGTAYACLSHSSSRLMTTDEKPAHIITFYSTLLSEEYPEEYKDFSDIPIPPPEDGQVELRWDLMGISITFSMKQVAAGSAKDYSFVSHELAGLAAIPRWEEGRLLVEIYPQPTNKGYKVESKLIWGPRMEGRTGDITLIGANEEAFLGEIVPVSYDNYSPRANLSLWDFGPVEPGEYTLRVPYLFLTTEDLSKDMPVLPIDLATGTWEDTPVELPFGWMKVASLEQLDPDDPLPPGSFSEPNDQWWRICLQWEGRNDFTCFMSIGVSYDFQKYQWTRTILYSSQNPPADNCSEWYLVIPEDIAKDIENIKIIVGRIQSYRWEQSFELPITVE